MVTRDYAAEGEPLKPRIVKTEFGDWQLDAYNRATGNYSEACWTFDTHAEAMASVLDFTETHVGNAG